MGCGSSTEVKGGPATVQPHQSHNKKQTHPSSDSHVKDEQRSPGENHRQNSTKPENGAVSGGQGETPPRQEEGNVKKKEPHPLDDDPKLHSPHSDCIEDNKSIEEGVATVDMVNVAGTPQAGTHWWDTVDDFCEKSFVLQPETKRKGWKTIRLFVSSTFKDMHSEREHLVKRVFPKLKVFCEERKLRLVECDLRWGVPKDADTREVLLACLSEIDRCREENTQPYFLNMLSERYGWVPEEDEVPYDIKQRYHWLPGMSVTSLEIFLGAHWSSNPNALFFLRDPGFLEACSDKLRHAYEEKGPDEQKSLTILKDILKKKFPERVHQYYCKVDGEDEKKLNLTGLETFGEKVMAHFQQAIERQYPADALGEELSSLEIQRIEHEAFMSQRSEVLLGRDKLLEDIEKYVTTKTQKPRPLVLVGFPGAGKSALIACCAKKAASDPAVTTFYHFVGATPGSTDLYRLLSRIWQELSPAEDEVPTDFNELKRSMDTVLKKASETAKREGKKCVILLIDALNQMNDDGDAHSLTWLPRELPENVRLIVSTLEGKCLNALRDTTTLKPPELSVEPLWEETRKDIVRTVLAEYNKVLDDDQLKILVQKEDAGRPLFLTVACEELRVFGEFRKLTQKIYSLAPDLTDLLKQVLSRIVDENGEDLVQATLCLIEMSRFGLLETELLELLGMHPKLPSAGHVETTRTDDKLPMIKWALVYLGLRQFLRPSGSSGEGRLDFYHRTISKAVKAMYLDSDSSRQWWHRRLAEYFWDCPEIDRKADELPFHLEQLQDWEGLKECLLDKRMFDQLYKEDTKLQLMSYWRGVGGYDIAAAEYTKTFHKYIQDNGLTSLEDKEPIIVKLAWFLIDIGEYDTAEAQLSELMSQVESTHGENSELLMGSLHAMVTLFYLQALKVVYSTHPTYKRCSQLGRHYSDTCIQVHRKYLPPVDLKFGQVLTLCGYFKSECLSEAKAIFEKLDFKAGLAEVLYMMGEKEQYNSNLSIPTDLFTRSLELCKSQFGMYHLKTARCFQLYGQMHWNNTISGQGVPDGMNICLGLYQHECDILENILGPVHPTTVRSREDVIIILQNLGRNQEADVLLEQQPDDKDV